VRGPRQLRATLVASLIAFALCGKAGAELAVVTAELVHITDPEYAPAVVGPPRLHVFRILEVEAGSPAQTPGELVRVYPVSREDVALVPGHRYRLALLPLASPKCSLLREGHHPRLAGDYCVFDYRALRGAGARSEGMPGVDEESARCESADPLGEIEEPWGGMILDPEVAPSEAGYVELLDFRALPSRRRGRAVVVRLTGEGGDTVFVADRRARGVIAEFDDSHDFVVGVSYTDPSRPEHVWLYREETGRSFRISVEADADPSPSGALCRALGFSGIADEVEILARGSGRARSKGALRRLFDSRFWHRPRKPHLRTPPEPDPAQRDTAER